ncbi:RING/U-box [Glarea lozoyensis ATCC 20868]|uniref:RING/U-box n=1 Tax=Glarea lozoyensis (strain ATCC 20868 / MF5171) TaxID=1116229 RepID=S3CTR0_GLAL2|nr:RING/U-box [Glarea lozoyensis ATCC 20868]EPE29060.1 RING/U-box [Glarea lozoyensis ATCC 20868]
MCQIFELQPGCDHTHRTHRCCREQTTWWIGRASDDTDGTIIAKIKSACPTTVTTIPIITPSRCAGCVLSQHWKYSTEKVPFAVKKEAVLNILPLSQNEGYLNDNLNDVCLWDDEGWHIRHPDDLLWLIFITQKLELFLQLREEQRLRIDRRLAERGIEITPDPDDEPTQSIKPRRLLLLLIHRIELNLIYLAMKSFDGEKPGCVRPIGILAVEETKRECAICRIDIGVFNEDGVREKPVITSCNHVFGDNCLGQWLREAKTCPICRTQFHGITVSVTGLDINIETEDDALPSHLSYQGLAKLKAAFNDGGDNSRWNYLFKDNFIYEDFSDHFNTHKSEREWLRSQKPEEQCDLNDVWDKLWHRKTENYRQSVYEWTEISTYIFGGHLNMFFGDTELLLTMDLMRNALALDTEGSAITS